MNASDHENPQSEKAQNLILKKNFDTFEVSLRDLCIKMANIQHVFSNDEFATLMQHIEALEKAAQEKKRLIGS